MSYLYTIFARKRIVFCKIYTAGKKFTRHPVVTVVTNFKSGRAPSTPRLSFYSFIMIVVDLQRWLWCKNIDETFVTLQNLFHTPRDIFLRIYIKSKIRLCNRCRLLCNVFNREEWLKVSCFVLHRLVIDLAMYFF